MNDVLSKILDEYRRSNKNQQDLVEEATSGLRKAENDSKRDPEVDPQKSIDIMRKDLDNPCIWP